MIKTWKHKGLRAFYETASKAGISAKHERRLTIILQRLDAAELPEDMDTPGMAFHKLKGNLNGFYAVTVNGNWRISFKHDGKHMIDVNYIDYH